MNKERQPSESGKKRNRLGCKNEHSSGQTFPEGIGIVQNTQSEVRFPRKSVPARIERQSNEAKKHIRKSGK